MLGHEAQLPVVRVGSGRHFLPQQFYLFSSRFKLILASVLPLLRRPIPFIQIINVAKNLQFHEKNIMQELPDPPLEGDTLQAESRRSAISVQPLGNHFLDAFCEGPLKQLLVIPTISR